MGVVLRVPVLYGDAEKPAESAVNVLMDAVWKAQEGGANVVMDHWALRYPTNTEDIGRVCKGESDYLLPVCLLSNYHVYLLSQRPSIATSLGVSFECRLIGKTDIAVKFLDTSDRSTLPTILQFSSEDRYTKYEICQLFAEIMGLPLEGMTANTEGNDPNASVQ